MYPLNTAADGPSLDVGCGGRKTPGAVGADRLPMPGVDVVMDLDVYPYPFPSDTFAHVYCRHTLEHVADVVKTLEELHRICRAGAHVHVMVPHFSAYTAFTDPTHRHFFGVTSFDYFVPGTDFYNYGYSKARFRKVAVTLGDLDRAHGIPRLLMKLANRYHDFYEHHLCFILRTGVVVAELEVLK